MQSSKRIDTLKKTFEFDMVFKNGARFNRDFMAIYAMPLNDFTSRMRTKKHRNHTPIAPLLLGFSISKKVAKACKRNLLRRQIKAIVRGMADLLCGYVFVFVCRKGIMEYDFHALQKHIAYSTKRLMEQKSPTHHRKTKPAYKSAAR